MISIPLTDGIFDGITNTTPLYSCQVVHSGVVTTYASIDGETYVQTDTTNMVCGGFAPCDILTDLTEFDASTWTNVVSSLGVKVNNSGDLSSVFRFIRYNSTDLTGTSADCPDMTYQD